MATTKIVQKIATGGISSTMIPWFKLFAIAAPLDLPIEARHIAHCAKADAAQNASTSVATNADHSQSTYREALINGFLPPVLSPPRALPA